MILKKSIEKIYPKTILNANFGAFEMLFIRLLGNEFFFRDAIFVRANTLRIFFYLRMRFYLFRCRAICALQTYVRRWGWELDNRVSRERKMRDKERRVDIAQNSRPIFYRAAA